MPATSFSVGDHDLQLVCDLSGKERIIYDHETVSEKTSLGLSSTHHFEVNENGETARYDVTFNPTLSGLTQYNVKHNNLLVKKGAISSMSLGLLRIFFVFLGLGLSGNSILFILHKIKFIVSPPLDSIISKYTINELNWFYVGIGVDLAFGVFLLAVGFFLKWILLKRAQLITTVLWIRIAIMIVSSPFLLWNSIQKSSFLDYRLGIVPLIVYAWVLWAILENCKEIAKQIKSIQQL